MGSRRKRAGIGPTESASRPRRGGSGRAGRRAVSPLRLREGGRATEGSQGLARSLALPRRSSRRRNCAEQLRATDLHARPGDTAAAAARSRRTPSHVTTCAAAAAASAANASRQLPARIRRRITNEHEKAPVRGPARRSPSLSFALLGSFLLGSTRSRQGDPRERGRVWGAPPLIYRVVVSFPSLAPSRRPFGLFRNWFPPVALTCAASP